MMARMLRKILLVVLLLAACTTSPASRADIPDASRAAKPDAARPVRDASRADVSDASSAASPQLPPRLDDLDRVSLEAARDRVEAAEKLLASARRELQATGSYLTLKYRLAPSDSIVPATGEIIRSTQPRAKGR